jgi:hypothetical protein
LAEFSVLKESEAPRPARTPSALRTRMAEYERYVRSVKRNQAGRITPGPGESARGIALRVSRAGSRIDRPVKVWVVDEVVYFSVS